MAKAKTNGADRHRAYLTHALAASPASYSFLVAPEPPTKDPPAFLGDLIDSLMLEGDPAHPHATLALLRTLTFDVSLLDAAEAQGEAHDAVVTSSAPWRAEPVRGVLEHLTLRENDVLQLLAHGMSNREIAKALTVTVNTVKTHLTGIYSKLDVHSRMEAVMRAQALGLVSTGAGTRSQTPDPRDHDREFSTRRNPVPRNHPDG